MIEARGLTKRYGALAAVDDLSFTVRPGQVTGFLGPNGAGKSTTMRLVLGLDRPSAGEALVCGVRYAELSSPLRVVGAVLDADALHPGRTAFDHLRFMARANRIANARVEEVLALVGLGGVARRRGGTFSLGMRQRLAIATALLGDPAVVLLDEPVNGLDPEGIIWVRALLRSLASEGKTVLVSSHLMSEMAQTADHLLVLGRGRLIADASVVEFVAAAERSTTRVRAPEPRELLAALARRGATVRVEPDGALAVGGLSTNEVGALAHETATLLYELTPIAASLEQAYLELADASVEFTSHEVNP